MKGVVFGDSNGNGKLDAGEAVVPNATVIVTESGVRRYRTTAGPDGSYEIPPGTVYGFPCTTKDGKISIINGLDIDAFSRERMTVTLNELNEERDGVKHLL